MKIDLGFSIYQVFITGVPEETWLKRGNICTDSIKLTRCLLETFESWTEDVDKCYGVDVTFLDFQKAFDKVPRTRLLQKLSLYEIEGKVLRWIADFLSDRKM